MVDSTGDGFAVADTTTRGQWGTQKSEAKLRVDPVNIQYALQGKIQSYVVTEHPIPDLVSLCCYNLHSSAKVFN